MYNGLKELNCVEMLVKVKVKVKVKKRKQTLAGIILKITILILFCVHMFIHLYS